MDLPENDFSPLVLNGEDLTLEDLVEAARKPGYPIKLSEESKNRIRRSREWVDKVQQTGEPVVYGVNTGFGSKATVSISKDHLRDIQRNLIMSHSAGTGDPLPIDVVRAAMIMRINTFAKGYSGVRLTLINTLLKMLEKGITPWIPGQGSLGASGDLAPLSHMALVISRGVREDFKEDSGHAYFYDANSDEWKLFVGKEAMELAGIQRIILEAKEGLALNNGTQISTAILASVLYDALHLVKQADIAMGMSLEALHGISSAFRDEIHQLRPHKGQTNTAENIRNLIQGSRLLDRHPEKVQDAYSLRCHPQVLAGVRDTLEYIKNMVAVEINATNDNPIILPDLPDENKAISCGNFHAQPIAFASDFLAIVLCEVGNIAERRIFRLSDKHLNLGLPSFLIDQDGLQNGLMLAQYTAAALVSENKSLAHPASVDSIPTCENQEDHVSMAPIAGRKARQILENVQKIVAIELLYAAQALDFRLRNFEDSKIPSNAKDILGKGTYAAYKEIRNVLPFIETDHPIYKDIQLIGELVKNNRVLDAVESAIGLLN